MPRVSNTAYYYFVSYEAGGVLYNTEVFLAHPFNAFKQVKGVEEYLQREVDQQHRYCTIINYILLRTETAGNGIRKSSRDR